MGYCSEDIAAANFGEAVAVALRGWMVCDEVATEQWFGVGMLEGRVVIQRHLDRLERWVSMKNTVKQGQVQSHAQHNPKHGYRLGD